LPLHHQPTQQLPPTPLSSAEQSSSQPSASLPLWSLSSHQQLALRDELSRAEQGLPRELTNAGRTMRQTPGASSLRCGDDGSPLASPLKVSSLSLSPPLALSSSHRREDKTRQDKMMMTATEAASHTATIPPTQHSTQLSRCGGDSTSSAAGGGGGGGGGGGEPYPVEPID
jgi:hypothetical protein